MIQISLITIGNELLKGRIVNTNASDIGEKLRSEGFTLHRVVTIADDATSIAQTVQQEMETHDVVLMSGGLGPTKDDITKKTLATLFDYPMVMHGPTLAFLEKRYQERGKTITKLSKEQALVPEGCEVIPNAMGTAPGMAFEGWNSRLYVMPGVPFEMRYMVEHEVIPDIQKRFAQTSFHTSVLRLGDLPESVAAEQMETIEAELPESLQVAYLPRHDGLWIELGMISENGTMKQVDQQLEQAKARIGTLFDEHLFTLGAHPVAQEIKDLCIEQNWSFSVAESLTGGKLSALMVEISGVSDIYRGSVTAYQVQIKEQLLSVPAELIEAHSVVSSEVSVAMAEGVRKLLGADFGLATTGYAEASGDELPHAWIGFSGSQLTDSYRINLYHDRSTNTTRTAHRALVFALKKLKSLLG
ncbi:CinA family nicotinamide mononucleotide deamidase-related protein [Pontibacter sp. G13]|uniref:CinA family nicotinamide mononucleotide deamidase-related protein n=1 Tax=Pontibacter sp. G13 TaxID=3074898 RepID=UPI00288C3586|nr:CinA family nicotinamide mononucleotide deamidase-related protein [Pontibacter sp. G13]WNJ21152.1 CinA family nicotinamide mononucleotide deamidase-related protein [Pontibacter sp. G13]